MPANTTDRLASTAKTILDAHPSRWEMLRAGDLKIDHEHYQRPQDRQQILAISRAYNPDAMGILAVSRRADGDYLMDGAHRALGVIDRFGPDHPVACEVALGLTIAEEAQIFYDRNSRRNPVKTLDKYRAAWMAADPNIAEIAAVLEEIGLAYPWHGTGGAERSIICWGQLTVIHRRKGAEHLRILLQLIERAWGSPSTALQAQFVKGVDLLVRFHNQDEFWSLDEAAARLSQVSASRIYQDSTTLRGGPSGKSKSAQQAIYEMLHFYYNKGRRLHKLDDLRSREPLKKTEPAP